MREAFRNTVAGEFGNCGRNSLIAPSTWNVDFSTMKDFRFNEKHTLSVPHGDVQRSESSGVGPAERGLGQRRTRRRRSASAASASTSQLRQIQFALKYHF